MTVRRSARAHDIEVTGSGRVPAVLAIGRLVEVWAAPDVAPRSWSAVRRFEAVRESWLAQAGVQRVEEQQRPIPHGSPWSVEHVTYRGQAERGGETAPAIVAERLARAGVTREDVAALRLEAADCSMRPRVDPCWVPLSSSPAPGCNLPATSRTRIGAHRRRRARTNRPAETPRTAAPLSRPLPPPRPGVRVRVAPVR